MKKESLIDFIDSKAIREHLKSINYELKADEAALFVFQSDGKLFAEKHEAYNWIIKNMPDVVLPDRTLNYKEKITLHQALKRHMEIENRLLEDAKTSEENAVYLYEYFYNKDDYYYYGSKICKTFEECKAIADEDEYNLLRIKKQWLLPSAEYPPYIEVSLLPDGRVFDIHQHNMLSGYDELIYRFLGDVLWFDTPIPFKKGDILTYNNKIPHIHYHGNGLMVFEKHSYWNMSEEKIQELSVLSDFYLNRDFDDSELRLLIDSLLFSKHIPYIQCKGLIEKLEGLSSIYFKAKVKHISTFPDDKLDNKQLFYTIDILDEAISKKRKILCHYLEYGTDKKLHKRQNDSGQVRDYIITPYQLAAKEGKYYLICNYDKYDDISNYRIDRICDIKILDEPAKPFEYCADGKSLNLHQYMREHIYMFSSENERVKFRITKAMIY